MNCAKIQEKIKECGLDALLLFSTVNIRYAAAFPISDGAVLIMPDEAWMFTDSRYIEAARSEAAGVTVEQFDVKRPLRTCIREHLDSCGCQRVGAEEGSLSHGDWLRYEQALGRELLPAQSLLQELRSVKEPDEVQSILQAQRIAESALDAVLGMIKPGIREREIAAELSYRMLLLGAEGNSFDPICISGTKTSMPHGVPGDEKVRMGDFVTMDFGCLKNGYCSDMTRTVAVGRASEEMRRVYDTVLRAQEAGIAAARPGAAGAAIHNAAAKVISDAGYGAFFGHSFGHSLGLEIHETPNASPLNDRPMPCGAVISAEPGIYIPGSFGVRIEDMLYLTQEGCENLTKAPKQLLIL